MRFPGQIFMVCLLFTASISALASPPSTVGYQGKLTGSGGAPIPNGSYSARFSLWSDATLGTESWSETKTVTVTDGLFSTELGSTNRFFDICPFGCDEWLQIEVTIGAAVTTMLPRTHLSASPWSLVSRAVYAEETSGLSRARGIIIAKPIGAGSAGASAQALLDADEDGDGVPESEISQSVTPTTSGVAIKVKGTGADKDRWIKSDCDDSSAVHSLIIDDDGDGFAEARGIIIVRGSGGTGAGSASSRMEYDSDDDGVPDNEISQSVTPTTSGVAIKTKGTGADANRTGEISQSVTPTTSGVAIKTKGTGADANRTIGITCDDSSAVHSLDIDDDGDGFSEARGIITVKSASGTTGGTASSRMEYDTDDDGVPDNEISQIVTPTTSGVAIKAKGTGADPNRMIGITCDDSTASVLVETDEDGDGFAESRGIIVSKPGNTGSASCRMSHDTDDDGVANTSLDQDCDATGARLAIKTKGGPGGPGGSRIESVELAGTGDSARILINHDTDGDGTANKTIFVRVKDAAGNMKLSSDSDDDGDADVSAETLVSDDSATFRLNGLPPGVPVISTIAMTATPTAVHMEVGAATCDGSSWLNGSDMNSKENFEQVDGAELLEKIEDLPITQWNYKQDHEGIKHIGPTAQDFKSTFGVGANDKTISTIDPSGIALAAIKQLIKENEALRKRISKLEENQKKLHSK